MSITSAACSLCGHDLRDGRYTRRIAVVDWGKDCIVAYRCPDCGAEEQIGTPAMLQPAAKSKATL